MCAAWIMVANATGAKKAAATRREKILVMALNSTALATDLLMQSS